MRTRTAVHADLLEAYRETLDRRFRLGAVAATTRLSLLRVARKFLGHYPNVDLALITPEHIERYLVDSGVSPRTMQTDLMRLRNFFKWCVVDQRLFKRNPCDGVTRPRWSANPRPVLTEEEFVLVCRACRTLEEVALVEVLFHTGLRVRECRRLLEGDIDCDEGWALTTGKGGRREHVFFPPHVADLIGAYLIGDPAKPLFQSPVRPQARSMWWIEKTVKRLGKSVGLPYETTAHIFRHGLAWSIKMSDMPLAGIQKVMRHQHFQTTIDMYGRFKPVHVRDLYRKHLKGRA